MNRRPATVGEQRSARCFTPVTSPVGDALPNMSQYTGCFVTLVAALFTISDAMADRSLNPSPVLDLVDAFNFTALDLHDLDLAALFLDGLPTQEPPVYPGHPNELYKVLPPVVNQLPVQTPLILPMKSTTEKYYSTETAENQTLRSSSTTEKYSMGGSTNQPSYDSDVTVSETEGLDRETTKIEARDTVVDNLRTPTVKESMPTTRQDQATPMHYEVKSTTEYETILPTLSATQPHKEYERNHEERYETNSPTRYEPSPHSPSTLFKTSSVFERQTTEALQSYPTTTALFVRMTDSREPAAYTSGDTYSTSLGYDVAHFSSIPTKTQTRASPHPTRSIKKVSSKQTKPISSKFASTIRSFTKARRPNFGEKLGQGEIKVKQSLNRPQRKSNIPSGHSKPMYDDINRRSSTKRSNSKQPTIKWVKIPSTRPPSTTPSMQFISEYKPIKIMHHRNPHRIRNQSTPLARTTTNLVTVMKEAPASTEVIAPYNSHSNPKLHKTTPSYDINTRRSPTTLHSKPSFEISMNMQQQRNPELVSHLFDEKPAVDYLESQPTAATHTTEDQTIIEVISTSTHHPAQTTAIKKEAYLRSTTRRSHPSGNKKRIPLRRRPDGSNQSQALETKEPSYYRLSTVKVVEHLSSTKQPTWYRPQKPKQAGNLPAAAGGSTKKNYATSYVISNNAFRSTRQIAVEAFQNVPSLL